MTLNQPSSVATNATVATTNNSDITNAVLTSNLQYMNPNDTGGTFPPLYVGEAHMAQPTHSFLPQRREREDNKHCRKEHSLTPGKRQRKEELWKCNRRKRQREMGLPYMTHRGIERPKREMKPRCFCKSKYLKCGNVTEEDRKGLFKELWGLTWEEKKTLVKSLVDKVQKVRQYTTNPSSQREFTFRYYLKQGSVKVEVCKLMFCNTMDLGSRFIHGLFTEPKNKSLKFLPIPDRTEHVPLSNVPESTENAHQVPFDQTDQVSPNQASTMATDDTVAVNNDYDNTDDSDTSDKSGVHTANSNVQCTNPNNKEDTFQPLYVGEAHMGQPTAPSLLPQDTEMEENMQDKNEHSQTPGKRERKEEQWKCNKRKRLREMGLPYMTQRGVERPKREMKPRCFCKSKYLKCGDVTEEDRMALFKEVWDLDWKEKKTLVKGLIDRKRKLKQYTPNPNSLREFTFRYYLRQGDDKVEVCRLMFCNTMDLGSRFIRGLFAKPKKRNLKSHAHYNRSGDSKLFLNLKFFDCLPKVSSHYCKKSSSKLYLEPMFKTIKEVHRLYVEKCIENEITAVGIDVFRKEFDKNNLALFPHKKDKCDICVRYRSGDSTEDTWVLHRERKEAAKQEKENDIKTALETQRMEPVDRVGVFCMSLQSILFSPMLKASALYYRRKLAVHNFTVFNITTRDVKCYVWHEGEGGLTSDEFSSCIIDYLQNLAGTYGRIILYSDGCLYQSKNATLASAIMDLARELNIIIDQKYLTKGHTEMEVDSVHSVIERSLKNAVINVPCDYINVFRLAGQSSRPYDVKYLDHTFFRKYSSVQEYSTILPGTNAGDVKVDDIRALRYSSHGNIQYKLAFCEDWQDIPDQYNYTLSLLSSTAVPALHSQRIPIPSSKYRDLQELKAVIPSDAHAFYDNLEH
ncbi:uncharacterized protein LOC101856023 isoform X2 [Aplysia californica]|nr:uncharacterized protein LOC101856023 isoform X2 [Aplysia californica]XP_005098561.1 uncharacterized protein LOC101856023 isoform X2 [Aplysia californica]